MLMSISPLNISQNMILSQSHRQNCEVILGISGMNVLKDMNWFSLVSTSLPDLSLLTIYKNSSDDFGYILLITFSKEKCLSYSS